MDGDQSFCLSFKEMHRFFSPSLKRRKKEKKRWTINSDEDIKLGHRLKFEFQDITADVKPPNRIQCNRIPLFCALKLPLFPDQPGKEKSIAQVLILMFNIMHPNEIRAAETTAEPLLTTCAQI